MLWDDGPMGTLAAPNLTSGKGGLGATFTDTDWVRGIRHGVHRDGTTLLIMPCEAFVHMNERDLGDLIAYLKQLPPVDREMPRVHLSPIGRTLLVLGKFSVLIAEKTPRLPYPAVVEPGPTAAYGRYLANFTGLPRLSRVRPVGRPCGGTAKRTPGLEPHAGPDHRHRPLDAGRFRPGAAAGCPARRPRDRYVHAVAVLRRA